MSRDNGSQPIDVKNPRSLARAISLIEEDVGGSLARFGPALAGGKRGFHIGVTGPPGAGKSTLIDAVITELRKNELTVGVIAVDPSSARTGGALLGDRIRMQRHATDQGVFIRSMGTRGDTGGLSFATRLAVKLLDAAGFDMIFIETVGVGQVGTEIESVADEVLLLFVPESGDVIQAMKAGIIEIADMVIINKSDRDGAEGLAGAIDSELNADEHGRIPVIMAQASRGKGIIEIAEWLIQRRDKFINGGRPDPKAETEFFTQELVKAIAHETINRYLRDDETARAVFDQVRSGDLNPYRAAIELLKNLTAKERLP